MINDHSQNKLTHNELIKDAVPTLAGTIRSTLVDPAVDRFSEDDSHFLKFHGVYQQDDRDLRKTGKHYMFMVRGRIPGGIVTPAQYLTFDRLASAHANNTLRITSRQGFQFHGVVKAGLGPLMKGLNEAMLTTLAACGDVARNVMAPPTPPANAVGQLIQEDAVRVSNALLPKTEAYHAIWVDGVPLDLDDPKNRDFADPLYGKTYLPRKFKTAFAIPPLNDVDLFTHCLGFIAITDGDRLEGYNLVAGGGLGMSHGNAETFPRLGDVIGFIPRTLVVDAARAVLTVHRDFGDRTNRKHARLKYVLEERGPEWFRGEVERRVGFQFEPARAFAFARQGDLFGWNQQQDGRLFLGLYVEAGRIRDENGTRLKTALRTVVERFHPEVRLTPSQNLILAGITADHREAIDEVLAAHGIQTGRQATALRRASMACPALPTCGLALAESERFLPQLLDRLEGLLGEFGLGESGIIVRMTGCPNGCVRPSLAEIGLVGKAPGRYNLYLGGNESSTRLNRLFKESVKEGDIIQELRPLLARYVKERGAAERFGDWCARTLGTPAAPEVGN